MKKWSIGLILIIILGCSGSRTVKVNSVQTDIQLVSDVPVDSLEMAWSYIELGKHFEQEKDTANADQCFQTAIEISSQYKGKQSTGTDSVRLIRTEQISREYSHFVARMNGSERDSMAADSVLEILEEIDQGLAVVDSDSVGIAIVDVIGEEQQITIPLVLNKKVENAINYFQGRGRRVFTKWLQRTGWYKDLIIPILKEEGVPEELFYLAMIESGFIAHARSYARAVGIWQFIAGTGKAYGLNSSWWYDDRRDPEKSTRAAARHLHDLYQRFNNWYLAIAGYNFSPAKIEKRMNQYKVEEFWELPRLPRQTRNYVPTFIAAVHIAKNPAAFGFFVEPEEPIVYDTVTIRECVDLNIVADCVNSTFDELKRLNPALLRWCTPPDLEKWVLHIPKGSKELFLTNYSKVPDNEKFTYVTHYIRQGETLSQISRKYGVSADEIKRFNKIKGSFIRAGQQLVIPYPQNKQYARVLARQAARTVESEEVTTRPVLSVPGREKHTHIVQPGETLWAIAMKYGVEINQIRRWNGLAYSRKIYPNQKLNIWLPIGTIPVDKTEDSERAVKDSTGDKTGRNDGVIIYTVREGDTLWDIANRYGVSISELKKWNNRRNNIIRPGDELKIITLKR